MTRSVVLRLSYWPDDADEPQLLDIAPRTVLAWEKAHRNRSATLLDNDSVRFEYLYEVAWIALDKPGGDYDKFCLTVDIAFAPDSMTVAAVDPTIPEASTPT